METWLKKSNEKINELAEYFYSEIKATSEQENLIVDYVFDRTIENLHKIHRGKNNGG